MNRSLGARLGQVVKRIALTASVAPGLFLGALRLEHQTRRPPPDMIFRSGLGALALDYTTVGEDLASHGYVVAGVDAPCSTTVVVMPDGRRITRTDPAGILAGRLDPGAGSSPLDREILGTIRAVAAREPAEVGWR